jgi:AraC-like DNA-binding protein
LGDFISMFYRFETDAPMFGGPERADIAHCRLILSGTGHVRFGDGTAFELHKNCIIGPRNRASYISGEGPGSVIGFGMLPLGWAALTGVSVEPYVERIADARDLLGPIVDLCRGALAGVKTLKDAATALEPILAASFENSRELPVAFKHAVDAWLAETLSPKFDDLVSMTGLSRNKAESHLRTLYGASPQLFIRKSRALRVANRIAHGEGDWQDYVGDAYYDQSHCIREIKYFTGLTPATLRAAPSFATDVQYRRRRTSPLDAHDPVI